MKVLVAAIYKDFIEQLSTIYEPSEADSITNILLEELFHISRIHRLTNTGLTFAETQLSDIDKALTRLLNYEPIQHIIGHEYFMDRPFKVNEHTLIPRPETEELVKLIIVDHKDIADLRILDIGTGTGCIPISLKLELPHAEVEGWDISEQAIEVARQNAEILKAKVDFSVHDVLLEVPAGNFDIIVSNPPYIPEGERAQMHQNVTAHEPETALFVPDHDPLIFYRRIAEIAWDHLNPSGKLYFEIHENFGKETAELLTKMGFDDVQIFPDMSGKDRMIRTTNPPR